MVSEPASRGHRPRSTGAGTLRGQRWFRLRQLAARLPQYAQLARLILALNRRNGVPGGGRARRLVLAGLAYLLVPLDPLPGFVPVLGQLDDLLVALFTLRLALRSLPEPVRSSLLRQAGLDSATVEHDWRLVWGLSRDLVAATGRGAWRLGRGGARVVARLGLHAGARLARRLRARLSRRSRARP
ncbi:YkvA family protein [Thermaerobacter subterraneus]|uniref:DUF1232 domain-containing protein n=1 Tax=Thermaerobacter subterraneus DSM 13965 TaxID=867903 RepID=K6PQC1_9FIRM|nr:YkvA family protein [Thermaerobacter subterraneus]EKP95137.1 hypothetical protein ThesuDRAFT_00866 [Thermaerobacter subterraneus DSM 13965]